MEQAASHHPQQDREVRLSRRAAYISFLTGLALLVLKFWAFRVTNSQAVFSDAMESIVNVVAAGLAIIVVIIAAKPADKDHPYGHGKVEYFSAAFEGGMIAFASVLICVEAVQALLRHQAIQEINFGLLVVVGAGLANLVLGLFLVHSGKKSQSVALVASGHHVISDFWTSVGVAIGLFLVQITGLKWLDAASALVVGILLGYTGIILVRRSIGGLLDEEDREVLRNLFKIMEKDRTEGIIQLHHCRVIRSGRYHHIDAHAVVPEFWDVAQAHTNTSVFEAKIMEEYPYQGELHLHVDPCRKAYCSVCEVENCPVRQEPFRARRLLSLEELTDPQEPSQFLKDGEEPTL